MKRIFAFVIIAVMLFSLVSCSEKASVSPDQLNNNQNLSKGGYTNLKQEEAKINLDADKSIILLDVRTPEEYADVHIPGSILIPLDTLQNAAEKKLTDKDATIYVYCRSGNRSASASKILADLGYKNIYNIGGIATWPYETEK
ncbi:MAG TPA: rhodanese-like domain-containing protein [Patescibacteria group bacterium]|nr:rhodanese-like domain-containing protein [Patescibacteria group bacterium]